MLTALTFAGCGKTAERQLYNEKLSKYINLGEYKGIKVDTKSDEFKEFYNSVISSDVSSNDLYVKKPRARLQTGIPLTSITPAKRTASPLTAAQLKAMTLQ